ncbi:MAG: hypothetical protein J4F42_22660 [Desulfurellaceae bacterium]|nr:hypothetical protein [Desulfurellaceae bacterium]
MQDHPGTQPHQGEEENKERLKGVVGDDELFGGPGVFQGHGPNENVGLAENGHAKTQRAAAEDHPTAVAANGQVLRDKGSARCGRVEAGHQLGNPAFFGHGYDQDEEQAEGHHDDLGAVGPNGGANSPRPTVEENDGRAQQNADVQRLTEGHFEGHTAGFQLGRSVEAEKKQGQEADEATQQDAVFSVPEGQQFADAQGPAAAIHRLQAGDGQGVDENVAQQQAQPQPDDHGPVEAGRPHEAGKNEPAELAGSAGKGQAVGGDGLAGQKIVLFRSPALADGEQANEEKAEQNH